MEKKYIKHYSTVEWNSSLALPHSTFSEEDTQFVRKNLASTKLCCDQTALTGVSVSMVDRIPSGYVVLYKVPTFVFEENGEDQATKR